MRKKRGEYVGGVYAKCVWEGKRITAVNSNIQLLTKYDM